MLEITVLPDQGVIGMSGIILANCESSVTCIRGLRAYYMCLWSVGVCSADVATRRLHALFGQQANILVCSNWQLQEKGDVRSVKDH